MVDSGYQGIKELLEKSLTPKKSLSPMLHMS